jgi:GNAT superfamily N-acetyltransferase
MQPGLEIVALPRQPAGVRRFLRVSYDIYRADPNWVAPLMHDQAKVFRNTNPFFAHADMQLWVATRHGRDVGRVAGIVDHLYRERQDSGTAFFGFFEAEPDPEISRRLFQTTFDWARQQGCHRILGPMNPTTNDECGLLVEGFDRPPAFMMPYNPVYYEALVEAAGFAKARDLLAFHIDLTQIPWERVQHLRARFQQRQPDLVIRPLLHRTFWHDLEKVRQLYNEAWQQNWGFVPMTEAEIDFMAQRLKPLMMEGLVWIAETAHEPVGFLLAVPDYNQAIQPLRGRLCTPRLLGFLPFLLGWKIPRQARVIALGVRTGFRHRGLESAMLAHGLEAGWRAGLQDCEASWVLEDNLRSRGVIKAMGGKPHKTYRLYQREL